MNKLLLPFALFPMVGLSQFSGGNGHGDAAYLITPTFIVSNIFSGGNGRGDAAALITPPVIASDIYSGGSGRGDVSALITPPVIPSNIYSGGSGRGDVSALITPSLIPSNIFSGGNGRGDVSALFDNTPTPALLVALRGVLEGPYNSSTGLMGDALRTAGLLPTIEPYTALGYTHVGGGGGESIVPGLLTTTGDNAIVDWVVVELRAATTPNTVLETRSALIQRDGDIVATDGVSSLVFTQPPGQYRVSLRHRNHLGVMTGSATALGLSTTPLDLSLAATTIFGTNARKNITGSFPTWALWAGDVSANSELKYSGPGNDRDLILLRIGGVVPTNTVTGYWPEDVNMDGVVRYSGGGNDRDIILVNIGGVVPTNTRPAQLP